MKEDLQLFLHQHTDVFTAWLGDILNKLKQVTKNPKPAGDSPATETTAVSKKKRKSRAGSKSPTMHKKQRSTNIK